MALGRDISAFPNVILERQLRSYTFFIWLQKAQAVMSRFWFFSTVITRSLIVTAERKTCQMNVFFSGETRYSERKVITTQRMLLLLQNLLFFRSLACAPSATSPIYGQQRPTATIRHKHAKSFFEHAWFLKFGVAADLLFKILKQPLPTMLLYRQEHWGSRRSKKYWPLTSAPVDAATL